jgi:KDO2-lipid IV(A) lauroyltransferase
MSQERSPRVDYLVYLVIRIVVAVVQILSRTAALRLADLLAALAYRVDRRHRLVADENLKFAFPQLDARQRDQMVRRVYRHFCRVLIEIIHLPRIFTVSTWKRYAELVNGGGVVSGLIGDRPLLMVTSHFGNWELAGFALGALGFRTYAIARTLDNPYLNTFLLRFREKTGQTILNKSGDFEKIQAVLASRGALATLGDQDAGQRGQFVEFFGRPASTHKAVALLAVQHDALMAVVGVPRVAEPLEYRIVVEEVIDPRDYAGRPDAVKVMTQRFTFALERLIRRYPEQYFWLHRRWKHQPKVREKKKAA